MEPRPNDSARRRKGRQIAQDRIHVAHAARMNLKLAAMPLPGSATAVATASHEDAPATSDGTPYGNRICSQHPNHLAGLDHRGLRRSTVARVAFVEYCIAVLYHTLAVWMRRACRAVRRAKVRSGWDGGVLTSLDYCRWVPSTICLTHLLLCLRERIDESKGHVVRGRV